MSFKWKKLGLTVMSASALFLAACGGSGSQSNEDALVDSGEITLAHVNWDDATMATHVVGTVLEDIGYNVNITSLDNAVVWQSVAEGQSDAMVAGWLPRTHSAQYEEYGDQMVHAGTNAEGAKIGLGVPTYMEDVNSIEDLNNQADQTITGIEPGAGIMESTQQAMEDYSNLTDWELQSSSTGAMTTELGEALENEEEIVFTAWNPHWMFQQYDIKYLEDPQGSYGGAETINTFTRQGLPDEEPIAYSVLENFQWDMSHIEDLMLQLDESGDPEQVARDWVDNNQDLVSEWTAEAEEMASSDEESGSEESSE